VSCSRTCVKLRLHTLFVARRDAVHGAAYAVARCLSDMSRSCIVSKRVDIPLAI